MTFEKFKQVLIETGIDELDDDMIRELHESMDAESYTHEDYICLCMPPQNGMYHLMLIWVDEKLRRKGIATNLLKQVPRPHIVYVDRRSEAMHHLLQKEGYKVLDDYEIDGFSFKEKANDGDKIYLKE